MTARVDRKGKSIREVAKGTGYARSREAEEAEKMQPPLFRVPA